MNKGDSIKINKFNNIVNFELPMNEINIIAGNDFDYKKDLIKALNTYFSTTKEDTKYIEYNGEPLKIYHKELLINRKEYRTINLDISNINLSNELSLSKGSVLRELINIYLEECYIKSDLSLLINSIIKELSEEVQSKDVFSKKLVNNIKLELITNDLSSKNFIDDILEINIKKNNINIPNEYLSFYEKTIIMLNIIEEVINKICKETQIILIIDNIDSTLNDVQIQQLYNRLVKLKDNLCVYIYIFTNNKKILSIDNNILKTVLININNSIVYFENYDEILVKVIQSYPIMVSDDYINSKLKRVLINHNQNIGNFVELSDDYINDIEEISVLKAINVIFEFKYSLNLKNEYLNNRFYSYLIDK